MSLYFVSLYCLHLSILFCLFQKLRDETTDRKKDLEQLETVGQWLSEHAADEPSVIANVEMQKTKLAKQLDEQQQKIDEKYMELQGILMHG